MGHHDAHVSSQKKRNLPRRGWPRICDVKNKALTYWRGRFIDELVASMPSDMPDLKKATNHLAPLTLPGQIAYYFPDVPVAMGFTVCETSLDISTR